MSALTEVIDILMYDDRSADHRMLTDQGYQVIGDGDIDLTSGIGLEVTEVTDMAILIGWATVSLTEWVEMRTGRNAAISQITELDNKRRKKEARQLRDMRVGMWVRVRVMGIFCVVCVCLVCCVLTACTWNPCNPGFKPVIDTLMVVGPPWQKERKEGCQ